METPTPPTDLASCPVCAEGRLHPRTDLRRCVHAGLAARVPMHYAVCDACGSEVANAAQTRANKAAMQSFRAQAARCAGKT